MRFTYGFARKKIHGKEYLYFWKYTGTGHKTEQYIGRVGKAETERRRLQVELQYLESLQDELTARILKIKAELTEEPSKENKKLFRELVKKKAGKPKKKRKKRMQVEKAVRP
ncbi:hypothetical protein KAU30_00175 [Candidatus Bathyarchaeota archaeon]|nr:hypothetical protein [Candidatus Bathyarchaeota archaeon]